MEKVLTLISQKMIALFDLEKRIAWQVTLSIHVIYQNVIQIFYLTSDMYCNCLFIIILVDIKTFRRLFYAYR